MRVCPKSKNLAFLVDVFPQTFYHEGFFYAEKMNTQEIWKPIAECNGIYHISNHGRVKSYKCGKERIMKPYTTAMGYLRIGILVNDKQKMHKIHRLVASAFIENIDNKPEVNHKDGNKTNNHIDNLEWVTRKENIQHGWDNGLFETTRLALLESLSKPVVDIETGKKYDSLTRACIDINEPYSRHKSRIFRKSQNQRFFFL